MFEKESPHYLEGKTFIKKTKIEKEDIFKLFVNLKIWQENENLDFLREKLDKKFTYETLEKTKNLQNKRVQETQKREDFTDLYTITIDGNGTKDFDDAISIEKKTNRYRLYVHIADVGYFVEQDNFLDKIAKKRVSSIYTPRNKIYMLPPFLSENLCSLKKNKEKYTISTIIDFDENFEIISKTIKPSIIKVDEQISYYEALKQIDENTRITTLYKLAKSLEIKREKTEALQISLPEINIRFDRNKQIIIEKKKERDNARTLIAEIMIIANHISAKILSENKIPAIFRTQKKAKKIFYQNKSNSVFLNAIQKKHLNRTVLSTKASHHSGLGLSAYVNITSPIRKYFDLINQRQIRGHLGLNKILKKQEIINIYESLETKAKLIPMLQNKRKRYWILKYLEEKKGSQLKAIVLDKRRDFYILLLEKYMIECKLFEKNLNINPKDIISVKLQYSNAKKDVLSVFL